MKSDVSKKYMVGFVVVVFASFAFAGFCYHKHDYAGVAVYSFLAVLMIFLRALNFYLAWKREKKESKPPTPVEVSKKSDTIIERFNKFFNDVPLYNGEEWKTLSVDEIVSVFKEAAVAIRNVYQQKHNEAVQEFESWNRPKKWWKVDVCEWEPPGVPTEDALLRDMAERSEDLSEWASNNQYRPFYSGSDMSYLVNKPAAVAARINFELDAK